MFIFLGMMMYLDIIALIIGRNFQSGIDIVPVMLLAYVILGMNFNVSMWYKLSGKTKLCHIHYNGRAPDNNPHQHHFHASLLISPLQRGGTCSATW